MKLKIRILFLFVILLVYSLPGFSSGMHHQYTTVQHSPASPGALIIDNTQGTGGSAGVLTNMRTGLDDNNGTNSPTTCENQDETLKRSCNSFDLKNGADLQVVQRNGQNGLVVESGVFNQNSTSYQNFGKATQARLFDPNEHLFDIEKFRTAAKELRKANTNLKPFTYGSISWQQFIDNVAHARTMYGLVRVEIPLQRLSDSSSKTSRYHSRSGKRYGFCGKTKTSTCGCGPGIKVEGGGDDDYQNTEIKPGATICGIKIPSFARIDVRGSILFDWVDCDTYQPIAIADLPQQAEDLAIDVSVPVDINPAYPDAENNMSTLNDVATLTKGMICSPDKACSFPLQIADSNYTLTPPAKYSRFNTEYDLASFGKLDQATRYAALLPSGYTNGWSDAFTKLNITGKQWRQLKFQTPTQDNNVISASDIRNANNNSAVFEDIPAYMYTGGMLKLKHHINISGLLYIPQAFDLEQDSIDLERRVKKHDEEYEHQDSEYSKYSYFNYSYSSEAEYHDHEYSSCSKKQDHYALRIPAKQYISGAIVVRDGFSIIVGNDGGATLISNDPSTYDFMRATGGGSVVKGFRPFKKTAQGSGSSGTGSNGNTSGGNTSGGNQGGGSTSPTGSQPDIPLWMEVRPR